MTRLRDTAAAAALAALLLAGCDSMPSLPSSGPVEPTTSTGTMTGESSDPRNRARLRTELAALYYERGNMAVALEELRAATAADPNYALAYSMFGLVYMELRENQLAQTNFERALRLAPNDSDINHNYGSFLCETGREVESLKYFQQALRNPLYPTPWRSWATAGVCALRKGNVKDAEDYLQRALRLDSDFPPALLNLAQIRYGQGNLDEARKLVTRFNRIVDPTAESLWLALRIERKLGERVVEQSLATQLRRRYANSREYQLLQRGAYD
jgi:type IV pilus assembly protein PilF